MSHGFYRAFEESFRGSREMILHRLEVYRPFFEPLAKSHPQGAAFDIGCGRGEWLETLEDAGYKTLGIDLDEGMLAACRELALNVSQGDGIAHLETLEDESQVIVSAFHVVEHVSFDQLDQLIRLAHQKLKPGGILILETPNPENVLVATQHFYLDPSHTRPIPSHLLDFICQFHGFARTKVIGLHETEGLKQDSNPRPSLLEVLGGSSRDYAVIAQKKGRKRITSPLNAAFQNEIGLKLEVLTERYDLGIHRDVNHALEIARNAESSAVSAHQRLGDFSQELNQRLNDSSEELLQKLNALTPELDKRLSLLDEAHAQLNLSIGNVEAHFAHQAEHHAQLLHEFGGHLARVENHLLARMAETEQTLYQIQNSHSWQVTAPLRWGRFQLDLLKEHGPISRTQALLKKILRPLAQAALRKTRAHPELEQQLYQLAGKLGLLEFVRAIRRKVEPDVAAPVDPRSIDPSSDFPEVHQVSNPSQDPEMTQLAGDILTHITQGH